MDATLSHRGALELARDSLCLAREVERSGGPPPERAAEFQRAVAVLEDAEDMLAGGNGLGFLPILAGIAGRQLLMWVIGASVAVVAVASILPAISGARRVITTGADTFQSIAETTAKAYQFGTMAAVGIGAYWLGKKVLKA